MKLRIGIELRKDFIVIDIKTTRNTSLTYEIPTICNKKSAIAWLIKVIKSPELLVKNISLDDITRSNDEGNSSITIDSDISEKELLKKCTDGETDIISINATFKDCPIVVGVDIRNFKPFVTLRNNKMPNLEELEKVLGLPRKRKERE